MGPHPAIDLKEGTFNHTIIVRIIEFTFNQSGSAVPLQEVIDKFEELYVGTLNDTDSGLWRRESPLITAEFLENLAQRLPLAVVTGRPRRDAERFLNHTGFGKYFKAVICMGTSCERSF